MHEPRQPTLGLVLGAGGILGAAWLIGSLGALVEVGLDQDAVAHVVGTSAGSLVGALVAAGVPISRLVDYQRDADPFAMGYTGTSPARVTERLLFSRARGLPRVALGSPELALRALLAPCRFPATTAAAGLLGNGFLTTSHIGDLVRLAAPGGWPADRKLEIVAVDYRTGRRVVFGRGGSPRCELAQAVQASCAIPGLYRPVSIGGRAYVDGGVRSPSNADLMAGSRVDLVIALNPMSSLQPGLPTTIAERAARRVRMLSGQRLGREVKRLRGAGKQVLMIQPSGEDLDAMGVNLMNPARRRLVLETAFRTTAAALAREDARDVLERLPVRAGSAV
jgi:NTE family protein